MEWKKKSAEFFDDFSKAVQALKFTQNNTLEENAQLIYQLPERFGAVKGEEYKKPVEYALEDRKMSLRCIFDALDASGMDPRQQEVLEANLEKAHFPDKLYAATFV